MLLLPEIPGEAVGRGGGGFPSGVSPVEILLDHLQEGEGDLAPRCLRRDDAVCCTNRIFIFGCYIYICVYRNCMLFESRATQKGLDSEHRQKLNFVKTEEGKRLGL